MEKSNYKNENIDGKCAKKQCAKKTIFEGKK